MQLAVLTLAIAMLLPSILIFRNIVANNKAAISTNLGVTMRIGAGDKATGGYSNSGGSVQCLPGVKGQEISDNQVVICVLKWYVEHPVKTSKLMINKTFFIGRPGLAQ